MPKDIYILYKTINTTNNKYYIVVHRQKNYDFDGYLGSGHGIKRAIIKYGKLNFKRETLVVGEEKYIFKLEKKYIDDKWKLVECYNLGPGGIGGNLTAMTEEHKKNISKGNLGKPKSMEHKKNISKGSLGKPKSMEHRASLLIARKNVSIETRKKMSESQKGKGNHRGHKHSPETILKIKAARHRQTIEGKTRNYKKRMEMK